MRMHALRLHCEMNYDRLANDNSTRGLDILRELVLGTELSPPPLMIYVHPRCSLATS